MADRLASTTDSTKNIKELPALAEDVAAVLRSENPGWLDQPHLEDNYPIWSRKYRCNSACNKRNRPISKLNAYDIEIEHRLWSLWGTIHPQAAVFRSFSRGKQYLACNVMACCAANLYRLRDWNAQLLDTIVISGDVYHRDSFGHIRRNDYEFLLEDLNSNCKLCAINFIVQVEHVVYGKLYCTPNPQRLNLAQALMLFFRNHQYGVLQCYKRSLAFGHTDGSGGGYFMYDCQSSGHPLFPRGEGASYVLLTTHLQVLLYCIVLTLNIPVFNTDFSLHAVDMVRAGAKMHDASSESA